MIIFDSTKLFIDEANLPFPIIAIELEAQTLYKEQYYDSILLVVQKDEFINIFALYEKDDRWNIMGRDVGDKPAHAIVNL